MKRWLALDDLDQATVLDLFMQAIIAHPKIPGTDSHVRGGMMEFAGLIKVELEVRLNSKEPLRKRA